MQRGSSSHELEAELCITLDDEVVRAKTLTRVVKAGCTAAETATEDTRGVLQADVLSSGQREVLIVAAQDGVILTGQVCWENLSLKPVGGAVRARDHRPHCKAVCTSTGMTKCCTSWPGSESLKMRMT